MRRGGVGRQFLLAGLLHVPGALAVMPDGSRGSAGKVEGTVTFGARGDPLLVLAAGQPGDHAGGQGGRRAQDRGQLVRAQLRPAFLDSAGLEPGDDLPSALLLLRGRVRFQAGLLQPVVRPGGLRCGVRGGGGGQVPVICCGAAGTRMRCAGEQRDSLAHRVEPPGSLGAQPVIPGHGVGMECAQPFLGPAGGGGRLGVSVGVGRGSAPGAGCLEQVRLREPFPVQRGCPAGPRELVSGAFLLPQHLKLPLALGGLSGVPPLLAASFDHNPGGKQRSHLRQALG